MLLEIFCHSAANLLSYRRKSPVTPLQISCHTAAENAQENSVKEKQLERISYLSNCFSHHRCLLRQFRLPLSALVRRAYLNTTGSSMNGIFTTING